ncbi:MAG: hypothetical protein DHS20C18_24870 [Saprospiraceae bacterium]|nr:MAG: hypothetical protein DHS20C18_24870 [Saprospiraceae bacterium]
MNDSSLVIKKIGFWSEESWSLRPIDKDIISKEADKITPEEEVLAYLKAGIPVAYLRTGSYSLATGQLFGPVTAFTDGQWAWTNILIYYYSIGWLDLPQAFKQHAYKANISLLKLGLMSPEKKREIAAFVTNPKNETIALK